MAYDRRASIIMAAYNRADVMRFAIQSVLQSSYANWELLVIGDGCTDHSEDVVAAFDDPRISFENLTRNSGGQAAPNNRGIERARGEVILFLNQDDFFLSTHIERSVSHLDATGAAMSWCPVILVQKSGRDVGPPDPDVDRLTLDGMVDEAGYDPRQFYLASSWAVRREAVDTVGPWKSESECRITPSQDWLYRAIRSGLTESYRRDPTVVAIHAGTRKLSYQTASKEHERVWSWVSGGDAAMSSMLSATAVTMGSELHRARKTARTQMERQIDEIAAHFSVHPDELSRFLSGEVPGEFIHQVRSLTTGVPVVATGQVVHAGRNISDAHFGPGWHAGESGHRWMCNARAEFVFGCDSDCKLVELTLSPIEAGQTVRVSIDDGDVVDMTLDGTQTIEAKLGHDTKLHRAVIQVDQCLSPKELGRSDDARPLGVALHTFRAKP